MEPNARILHCRESNKERQFFAPQDLPARAYVPLWAVGLVGEKRSHQKLFWIKQNGSLTTTSGSSSAVERRLPKPDVAGSIPVSRSKSEPPARQLQPSTRERELIYSATRSSICLRCSPTKRPTSNASAPGQLLSLQRPPRLTRSQSAKVCSQETTSFLNSPFLYSPRALSSKSLPLRF